MRFLETDDREKQGTYGEERKDRKEEDAVKESVLNIDSEDKEQGVWAHCWGRHRHLSRSRRIGANAGVLHAVFCQVYIQITVKSRKRPEDILLCLQPVFAVSESQIRPFVAGVTKTRGRGLVDGRRTAAGG